MSTYTIASPSLDAILSDDALYFEGIRRPLIAYAVHEDMAAIVKSNIPKKGKIVVAQAEIPTMDSEEHVAILERYFGDLYGLFLKKLGIFSGEDSVSGESSTKLQALLQEMIKVKGLIEAAKDAISKAE